MASEPTGEGLTLPTRGAWPKAVPDGARWLVAASGKKLEHWLIDHAGATLTTWSGSDPAALKQVTKKWKNADTAATALDAALRKQLAAGFVFGAPAAVRRGEPLCALHVGDGSNAEFIDLSPDGRTLAVGTILAEARAARLHLIDIETGRRTVLHEEKPAQGQAFIHRVAFGPGGVDLYYQMNTQLCVIPVAGGTPKVLADMAEPPLNPFVTRFGFDRSRERLLYFEKSTIRVRTTAGKDISKIPFKEGTSEYREAAISPSGKLIALVYVSRGVLYSHDDAKKDGTSEIQIWSVDGAKQLYTLPFKSEMLRRITFSPDDRQIIVGNYSEVVARDIRTGAQVWRRDAREWAHSPDGSQLATVRRGIAVTVLDAATQREAVSVHDSRPWATPYAEIHDPQTLGFSDDGNRMYMGNGGGRVYVWQAK